MAQSDAVVPAAAEADRTVPLVAPGDADEDGIAERAARQRASVFLKERIRTARGPLVLAVGAGVADGLLLDRPGGAARPGAARGDHRGRAAQRAVGTAGRTAGHLPGPGRPGLAGRGRGLSPPRLGSRRRCGTRCRPGLARLGPAFLADRSSGAVAATAVEQVEAVEGFFARYLPQMALRRPGTAGDPGGSVSGRLGGRPPVPADRASDPDVHGDRRHGRRRRQPPPVQGAGTDERPFPRPAAGPDHAQAVQHGPPRAGDDPRCLRRVSAAAPCRC